jgi:YlmC/YmxH family sporulation protein
MRDKGVEKDVLLLSQLRQMEVVDITEGKRLGFISDIIFDDDLKRIESFVVPPEVGIFSIFKKRDEMHIRWNQIKVIGVDIILVDLSGKSSINDNSSNNVNSNTEYIDENNNDIL